MRSEPTGGSCVVLEGANNRRYPLTLMLQGSALLLLTVHVFVNPSSLCRSQSKRVGRDEARMCHARL